MRRKILMIVCAICLVSTNANAQWLTFDPGNLAQSIINTVKNVLETSKTVSEMTNNFKETKKIYEQGVRHE